MTLKSRRLALLVPILLIQAACVGTTTTIQRYPDVAKGSVSEPVAESEPRTPPPTEARPAVPEAAAPEDRTAGNGVPASAPPAVLALLSEARANVSSGDLDNAAASLERAIRIQPRNPRLWHELAEVRLKQRQPGLAEDLAKKSNVHAKGDSALIRANWSIVAEARRLTGDPEGEAEARRKAGE